MKALVYNGPRDVSVQEMPDAKIEQPTDVLVKDHHHQYLRFGLAHVRRSHGSRVGQDHRPRKSR